MRSGTKCWRAAVRSFSMLLSGGGQSFFPMFFPTRFASSREKLNRPLARKSAVS